MADKSLGEVFVYIFLENVEFHWGKLVNRSERGRLPIFQRDSMVVWTMGWEFIGFFLAKDFGEFVVFRRDTLEVGILFEGNVF